MEKQSNITNFGWVEMRIPYAALRFSAEKNKLGVLIFSGNKTIRQNTLGTLLIQNLALSHNKPNFEGIAI
jgi:hypothetical protein